MCWRAKQRCETKALGAEEEVQDSRSQQCTAEARGAREAMG